MRGDIFVTLLLLVLQALAERLELLRGLLLDGVRIVEQDGVIVVPTIIELFDCLVGGILVGVICCKTFYLQIVGKVLY